MINLARAWMLQSNPALYDIDSALRELDKIDWRVPQHTSEVQPGDVALIWRSGSNAGVVGIGRILTAPRAMSDAGAQDSRFVRGESEGQTETRTTVRVAPVELVPKAEVAAIPVMAEHPIITGPMGTVFALSPEQWSALAPRVPEPPAMTGETSTALPAAFAWNDRRKSVSPLPRVDAYLDTLNKILHHVEETQPEPRQLDAYVSDRFDVSNRPRPM